MQKYKVQVIEFAKNLEGEVPLSQIASLTKHEFNEKCSPATVSNILSEKPEYFNQKMVRKIFRKPSLKSWLIKSIKSLKDDDPKIGALVSEFSELVR